MLTVILQAGVTVLASAGVASLVTLLVGKRYEHQRWLRDQELRASEKFLRVVYGMSGEMLKLKPGDSLPDGFLDRVAESEQSALVLIAPRPVIEAAQVIPDSIVAWYAAHIADASGAGARDAYGLFRDSITGFVVAVRSDLKTDGKGSARTR